MHPHIVIIGGTGVLAAASKALAGRCEILTSVARTERSLRALDKAITNAECEHHLLALDWSEPSIFLDSLAEHVKHAAPPTLVLAWLHKDKLGPKIAAALAPQNTQCDFFQVRGSAVANLAQNADYFCRDHGLPKAINYHQIILGFHLDNDGPRWLSNAEISAGVLSAIDKPKPVTIVGSVAPWPSHP